MKKGLLSYRTMAEYQNERVFTHYFNHLMLISKSVYEWINLPEGINEKWIENYLFSEGKCLFFKDKQRGFMITALAPNGRYNVYNEETIVRPHAIDYQGDSLINGEDCVIIRNNDESLPTSYDIQLYAFKLTNIERTIDVNIEAQKTPVILQCSEKERMSFINFNRQRQDNEPAIMVSDSMNTKGITAMNLNVPMVFKDLEYQKHMVWNECMTFLGINNANQDKRERLVDDEVQANNEQVEASLNTGLKARQKACEEINKVFGLTGDKAISVRKRIQEVPKLSDSEPSEEDSKGSEDDYIFGGV